MGKKYIDADKLIKYFFRPYSNEESYSNIDLERIIKEQPTADVIERNDVLGWLLAYHTLSSDLHGRYLPHEVIGWLINDISKNLLVERREDGRR